MNEPVSVPPKVAVPVTCSPSYCDPWVVPPISIFRLEPVASCRSPFTDRVPAAFLPPGSRVPWFTSAAALVPTAMVPLPDKVPVLVKPLVLLKVAPPATAIVPDWVKAPLTLSVPLLALMVPLLLKLLLPVRVVTPLLLLVTVAPN